jgi:hypothetical protein
VKTCRQGRKLAAAVRIGALLFILLIAFTRLYLGLHFPTDILAGWLLGALILALAFLLEKRATALLDAGGLRPQLLTAAAIAILMNALYPAGRSLSGLFLGFSAGSAGSARFLGSASAIAGSSGVNGSAGFSGAPALAVRCLRFVLGIAGGALIYRILKAVFPGGDSVFAALPFWGEASPYYDLGRFVRYGLLGLWASAGAPWLFRRLPPQK